MKIDEYFDTLIPRALKETKWPDLLKGSLVDFYKQYFKPEKIDLFETNSDVETRTLPQLIDFLESFGFQPMQREGYTSSTEYLRREARVAGYKILKNSTKSVFPYVLYPFNLSGSCFPLTINTDYSLQEYLNPTEDPTGTIQVQSDIMLDAGRFLDEGSINILYYISERMDSGLKFDAGVLFDKQIPVFDTNFPGTFWYLDGSIIEGKVTRHFIVAYHFVSTESSIDFMSYNTAFVFYNKLLESKSEVSVPHFQPVITCKALANNTEKIVTYVDEINGDNGSINSILINEDLNSASKIQFGSSKHNALNLSITGVNTLVHEEVIDGAISRETNLAFPAATLLSSKYFIIPTYKGINYTFWYNVDGVSTQPSVPGNYLIEIAVLSTDTADIVKTKSALVVSQFLNTYFYISQVDATTIKMKMKYPIYQGLPHDVNSGVVFTEVVPFAYGFNVETVSSNILELKQKIYAYTTFLNISEVALLDSMGNCIFYSKFPKVNFYEKMLSSIKFRFLIE